MTREQALNLLSECRARIDEVDRQILALLNERTRIVEQIGRAKQSLNLPIYEPKREDEVFQNVAAHNGGPLPQDAVRRVFERIIDEMRTVQKRRMLEKEDG
jgi:chorismate mutase-like protein